jgi:Glycosyl hydrolase family 10
MSLQSLYKINYMRRSFENIAVLFFLGLVIAGGACRSSAAAENLTIPGGQEGSDPRDDSVPWGVATGSEWLSAYPKFNPILRSGGVGWLRASYEWQTIQPKQGYWNWVLADRLVENARTNGLHLTFPFVYLASWASADGGTRKFPIKDLQYWRDYVSGLVERYHPDVKYWEVWNEFNGSFSENGSPEIYADLVREASIAAKKIDPTAKIGMSVANFDVGFLDAAIKAGASGHFDYICIHPYEKLNDLDNDGEVGFLSMTTTLRQMLAANHQPAELPLWITELGAQTSVAPDQRADRVQAILLTKAYLLALFSGFQRVFWFEARGPSYGRQTDHGLIRADFTLRPSYHAMKVMSDILGQRPEPIGWLNLDNGGFGFLFKGNGREVLASWAPASKDIQVTFPADVQITDLEGKQSSLSGGQDLILSEAPQFITNVPTTLVDLARANSRKPYPWTTSNPLSRTVSLSFRGKNLENGIRQVNPDTTLTVTDGESSWRRTDFSRSDSEGHYVYLAVAPQFVPFGTRNLKITVVVRRLSPSKTAGMGLNYESTKGYVDGEYFNIPEDDQWHELTWKITDANFVGGWGWNFRFNAISSPNEFAIKEVRVDKMGSP